MAMGAPYDSLRPVLQADAPRVLKVSRRGGPYPLVPFVFNVVRVIVTRLQRMEDDDGKVRVRVQGRQHAGQ
jgi:hypothetical protein